VRLELKNCMKSNGFTLIELSIVIMIIAFLIGAITSGKELMHASKLRSVISEIGKYRIVYNSFKLKYTQYPGDFNRATKLWPAGGLTFDGNGNGHIHHMTDDYGDTRETLYAWQHLSLAGMIDQYYEGKFDALVGDGEDGIVIGKVIDIFDNLKLIPDSYAIFGGGGCCGSGLGASPNIPESVIKGGAYFAGCYSSIRGCEGPGLYNKFGNFLGFAAPFDLPPDRVLPPKAIVTASDASAIDKKSDDGLADKGATMAIDGVGVTGCIKNPGTDDSYNLDDPVVKCRMVFWLDANF